jgi:hypothetical protein
MGAIRYGPARKEPYDPRVYSGPMTIFEGRPVRPDDLRLARRGTAAVHVGVCLLLVMGFSAVCALLRFDPGRWLLGAVAGCAFLTTDVMKRRWVGRRLAAIKARRPLAESGAVGGSTRAV